MHILDLPNEVLERVFVYGGVDQLVGGLGDTCRRLRSVSNERVLWEPVLAPELEMRRIPLSYLKTIDDCRLLYYQYRKNTVNIVEMLDAAIGRAREATSFELAHLALPIVTRKLNARYTLSLVMQTPRTLMHYHWAVWLSEAVIRLEGFQQLKSTCLDLVSKSERVENTLDCFICMYQIVFAEFPQPIIDLVTNSTELMDLTSYPGPAGRNSLPLNEAIKQTMLTVERTFAQLKIFDSPFFNRLGKCALFFYLAKEKLGWDVRLINSPIAPYVFLINCDLPRNGVFVDFVENGCVRSFEDMRSILRVSGTLNTAQPFKFGYTIAEIFRCFCTESEMPVFDPKSDDFLYDLKNIKRIQDKLDKRPFMRFHGMFNRIFDELFFPQYTEANIPQVLNPDPLGILGQVIGVLDSYNLNTFSINPQKKSLAVVLEADGVHGFLLLTKEGLIRVTSHIIVAPGPFEVKQIMGLEVPDIQLDFYDLGRYFKRFNTSTMRFE